MKKVAVFGNAGGGKSTLSKHLSENTGLPWIPLDSLQYKPGGEAVPYTDFKAAHDRLIHQDQWIIDGFGSPETLWQRLDLADTLVYIDLPVFLHAWWVTKRFLQGAWVKPMGWPDNSSLLKGTLNSYKVIRLCHTKLTPKYREYIKQPQLRKRVYHLQSHKEIASFHETISRDTHPNLPRD